MKPGPTRTLVAASLAWLVAIPLAPASAAPLVASLTGRIVSAGTDAPLAGATVHVADGRSGRVVASAPTGADGAFEVSGLAPATYDLAVESRGGLYPVETPLRLAAGERRSLQLALSRQAAPSPTPAGQQEPAAAQGPPAKKKKTAADVWNNPLTATLIVVGAAVVVGLVVESVVGNDPSSPSVP